MSLVVWAAVAALAVASDPTPAPRYPAVDPDTIKVVHVVQSNHLDVGFADYAPRIMNRYFTGGEGTGAPPAPRNRVVDYESFFLKAINTSNHVPPADGFRYLTHAYLLSYFFDCPGGDFPTPSPADALRCPNASTIAAVKAAVSNGTIFMHAYPHNGQLELHDATSFTHVALRMAKSLAAQFGVPQPTVLSQRDVPGLTRGAVPLLAAANVSGVWVGVNDGTPPPLVPSTVDCYAGFRQVRTPFVWADVATNTSIVADFHPGGYGGITGGIDPATHMPYFARDGTLCDCVGVPGLEEVLCGGWRGDNYGPADVNETTVDFKLWRAAFPNAVVKASRPEDFFEVVNRPEWKSKLPVLTSEIGDTWMYGVPSDPVKVAQMRVMMRQYGQCVAAGVCTPGSRSLYNFERWLSKLPEHTWGGCGCLHMNVTAPTDAWTVSGLAAARASAANTSYIHKEELSWGVQRAFINKAVAALDPSSPLAAAITGEFEALQAPPPSPASLPASGYAPVPPSEWGTPVDLGGDTAVGFDPASGGLTTLRIRGVEWASSTHPVAAFMYRSHSYGEAVAYRQAYNYNHGGPHPYHEPIGAPFPGMNATQTVARQWKAPVSAVWHRPGSILLRLQVPTAVLALGYGAPTTVWLNATVEGAGLLVEAVWEGKQPARLLESTWLQFRPVLNGTGWTLLVDKMGSAVDASDVVVKGGAALHGVDPNGGVAWVSGASAFRVASLDAGVVAPGGNTNPYNFTAFDRTPVNPTDGASFCLHNNLYSTNYVLWFPWLPSEASQRFRFRISTQ